MSSWAAAGVRARCSFRARVLYKISWTSELLPDPLTPVTAIRVPRGNETSRFFRLFCRAPLIVKVTGCPLFAILRLVGTGMACRPERYFPVRDRDERMTSGGGP